MVPCLFATWVMAFATPECSAPIRIEQSSRMKRSAMRVPVAGFRFGVGGDPLDLAAEHPALGVELLDRDLDAAQVVLARVAVLAAGVAGEPELDRLSLRVGAIVRPRPEECAGAGERRADSAALQQPAPGEPRIRHSGLPGLGALGARRHPRSRLLRPLGAP